MDTHPSPPRTELDLMTGLIPYFKMGKAVWFRVAEGLGFEPTEPFGSPVFKTVAIDYSTTPTLGCTVWKRGVECAVKAGVSNEINAAFDPN